MNIGFPPKIVRSLDRPNLTSTQLREVLLSTMAELGFTVLSDESNLLRARSPRQALSWGHKLEIRLEQDKLVLQSSSGGPQVVDFGSNEELLFDFISVFERLVRVATGTKQNIASTPLRTLDSIAESLEDSVGPPHPAQSMSFLSLFVPKEGYQVTPVIAVLNVLVFAGMIATGVGVFQPDAADLIAWGANFRPLTLSDQSWRLITSCFVHIGVIHLAMNVYALVYIGLLLEPFLGSARTVVAYVVTGFAASATSLLWHPASVSAGASGAIFGLYGVFLALLTTKLLDEKARRPLLSSIGLFVAYNLLYGMKGDVDNAAHIGGLFCGIIVGYSFVPSLKTRSHTTRTLSPVILSIVAVVGLLIMGLSQLKNDGPRFDELMQRFEVSANQAFMSIRQFEPSKNNLVTIIHEQAIPHWETASAILDSVATLELPEPVLERNKKLQRFCELQVKLLHMAASEVTSGFETDPIQSQMVQSEIRQLANDLGLVPDPSP